MAQSSCVSNFPGFRGCGSQWAKGRQLRYLDVGPEVSFWAGVRVEGPPWHAEAQKVPPSDMPFF